VREPLDFDLEQIIKIQKLSNQYAQYFLVNIYFSNQVLNFERIEIYSFFKYGASQFSLINLNLTKKSRSIKLKSDEEVKICDFEYATFENGTPNIPYFVRTFFSSFF
jgi:hypothetical protein